MKNSTPRRQLQKLQLLNFLAKFLAEKVFKLCEAERSVDKILKSPFSSKNDGLKAVFYKHFPNELAPVPVDVYESLTPWVLPLEQESYLPYLKNVIKEILKTIHPFHF